MSDTIYRANGTTLDVGGGSYTLPTATSSALGGVKAEAKTDAETSEVKIGQNAKLYTAGGRVETGSYLGTGAFGEETPNGLTFTFAPKLVFIANQGSTAFERSGLFLLDMMQSEYRPFDVYGSIAKRYAKKSADGKTLSWYFAEGANHQLNLSGETYYYVAIG